MSPFTHLAEPDAAPNGRTRLTLCGVYVRREACQTPQAVTCPVCRGARARMEAEDADYARRAAALGISVEELVFGRADDVTRAPECPAVPR
jgi:hypothetical protein